MGVDANCIVGYGIIVGGSLFKYEDYENEGKIFSWCTDENDYGLNYDYEALEKIDGKIVVEPYDGRWTFIGIEFLSKDINETIENLKTVKDKWNVLYKELMDTIPESEISLREQINKETPQIIKEPYYS